MGYLLIAGIFFMIYYLIKENLDKKSIIKAAESFVELTDSDSDYKDDTLAALKKNTNFYLINKESDSFEKLNGDTKIIPISDLNYKSLVRFQKLIESFKNNTISDFEFFTHNRNRHLVFPFQKKNGASSIVILERDRLIADDFFNKHPK